MPSKKLSAVGKTQTYLRKDSTVMCQKVTGGVDRGHEHDDCVSID